MKTIKRSFRVWFAAVLFISAGALCSIWALGILPPIPAQDCLDNYKACINHCATDLGPGENTYDCNSACGAGLGICLGKINSPGVGAGAPGQNLPPNAVNPISSPSPTPRRNPIKGPPHRLGPSPSPTSNPILLAKPTSPTPSPSSGPKKHGSSHGHQ